MFCYPSSPAKTIIFGVPLLSKHNENVIPAVPTLHLSVSEKGRYHILNFIKNIPKKLFNCWVLPYVIFRWLLPTEEGLELVDL